MPSVAQNLTIFGITGRRHCCEDVPHCLIDAQVQFAPSAPFTDLIEIEDIDPTKGDQTKKVELSNLSEVAEMHKLLWGQLLARLLQLGIRYDISFLCPVIGGGLLVRYIAGQVTKEAIEELAPQYSHFLTQAVGTLFNKSLIFGYMKARKIFKFLPQGMGDQI